jgi:hypothetical protein
MVITVPGGTGLIIPAAAGKWARSSPTPVPSPPTLRRQLRDRLSMVPPQGLSNSMIRFATDLQLTLPPDDGK